MRAWTWLPRPLARALVIRAARLAAMDPELDGLHGWATSDELGEQVDRDGALGYQAAGRWPATEWEGVNVTEWKSWDWANLAHGLSPTQIEADRLDEDAAVVVHADLPRIRSRRPVAGRVAAWAGRACAGDPALYLTLANALHARADDLWEREALTEGQAIAGAWPTGAHPGSDTSKWHVDQWADLADGSTPEQVEAYRRRLYEAPSAACFSLDGAAAEAARLIPDDGDDGPVARVLLAVLLHAAVVGHRTSDDVLAWAGDLNPDHLDDVHAPPGHGGDTRPAHGLLTLTAALPAPDRARISAVITTALTTADTTTPDPARSPQP